MLKIRGIIRGEQMNPTQQNSKLGLKFIFILFLLGLILRSPTFFIPLLDVDEAQFAEYANALLNGGIPYIASVDTKPPAIYYFYALIFFVFGKNNMTAVHIVSALWISLTAVIIANISLLISSRKVARWAGLFYIIFCSVHSPKFTATSIASIMALPITLSFWHFLKGEKEQYTRNNIPGNFSCPESISA